MPSVTRKPQANRQERREQIERQLLDATERLMADGASFTELSVDRLATEAGISRASFYIYFEDKGHLLRRLAGQVFDDLADAAERWWGVARRRDPADVLRRDDGDSSPATGGTNPCSSRSTRWRATTPRSAPPTARSSTAIAARLAAVIEEGQDDGFIRRELSADDRRRAR